MSLQAVTFDYWNTLVFEDGLDLRTHRIAVWTDLLERAGVAVEREVLESAYASAWLRYVESWKANEQFPASAGAAHILTELGLDLEPAVREELIEVFEVSGESADLRLTEGITECLETLRRADISLGIVCDVGFTPSVVLRGHLRRHGVLDFFDHWSFSDEVGHYKPSPVIFDHALSGLGNPDPGRAAHVGDIRRTDIAGARAMGMVSVRYTGVSDDATQPEPEGDHVIAHHKELPSVLGIG